ncbi:hypothetical protein GDO81_019284 [Engystomops pustulosus]|uniref:Uncharacterized protein n=1 Tax=Engystomops pustulosus TaxID=76066 RepID=A0AAV6YA71_ENGPU|nr:hypothetical protein GDO81_019284 [Engystomops pustulosus]
MGSPSPCRWPPPRSARGAAVTSGRDRKSSSARRNSGKRSSLRPRESLADQPAGEDASRTKFPVQGEPAAAGLTEDCPEGNLDRSRRNPR